MFQGMNYVYEVYKEKSFSKAAKNLYISQPSLSANVRRVEAKIGYPIFNRNTSPLTLTECGERYIQSVEEILAIENSFASFVNDLGGLKTGHLTLGGSSLFSSCLLPSLIGEFTRHFPLVTINLIEESTARLEELLLAGVLDLAIDNYPFNEAVFGRRFFHEEHLLLAVPKVFPINRLFSSYQLSVENICSGAFLDEKTAPVPLGQFKDEPFVLLKQENDTRRRSTRLCQANGFSPRVVLELDQQMTSYHITCAGMGISFISDTLVRHVTPHPDVIYYKLPGEETRRNLYFYWKNGKYISRAMEEFLNLAIVQ